MATELAKNYDIFDLKYARGFLFTRETPKYIPVNWESLTFGTWKLYYDSRVSVYSTTQNKEHLILVGEAIDTRSGRSNQQVLADMQRSNISDRQSYFDHMVGRYACIQLSSRVTIRQDAAGMRSLFYTNNLVASHAKLAAEQVGLNPSIFTPDYLRSHGLSCMPGNYTEFADVFALTPNTEIDLVSNEIRRFYAGALERTISVDDAVEDICSHVGRQIPRISETNAVLSLSAGLDSRTSAALLRPLAGTLSSFTYDSVSNASNPRAKYDVEIASLIAKQLDIPFEVLQFKHIELSQEILNALKENHYKSHSRQLAIAYLERLSNKTNIRSNVYGIGRDTYGSRSIEISDGLGMCRLAYGSKVKDNKAIKAFNEFIEITDFPLDADVSAKDLFLWEHRIGVWQSAIYAESDLSHASHVLVNQNHMLKTLLSVPLADRKMGTVQKTIIKRISPELTQIPVNGETF
ncbi:hypothetical protein ACT3R5_14380 [Glutamicibacter sp. AOP5-A2-7]